MRIPTHLAILSCLAVPLVPGAADASAPPPEPDPDPDLSWFSVEHLLTYIFPFVAYYIGILVRYHAKFLHDSTPPPLKEQLVAGIVFSVVAVAPLIPSIRLAVWAADPIDLVAYMLVVVVIMQEGLVLHERAVAGVKKLVRRGESPPVS